MSPGSSTVCCACANAAASLEPESPSARPHDSLSGLALESKREARKWGWDGG